MTVTHWIIGGDSMTADAISGSPPTDSYDGNSSFLDYPMDGITAAEPKSWAGMVAQEMGIISSTVNVATIAHGNMLTARAILYLLKHYNYKPENTFILFSIANAGRYDMVCDLNDAGRSTYTPWTEEIIPFGSKPVKLFKTQKSREIERCTSDVLHLFINYLKEKNFKFLFTSFMDFTKHPDLSVIINENLNCFVPCGDYIGMREYCEANNLTISDEDFHPSYEGHKAISRIVTKFIKENKCLE